MSPCLACLGFFQRRACRGAICLFLPLPDGQVGLAHPIKSVTQEIHQKVIGCKYFVWPVRLPSPEDESVGSLWQGPEERGGLLMQPPPTTPPLQAFKVISLYYPYLDSSTALPSAGFGQSFPSEAVALLVDWCALSGRMKSCPKCLPVCHSLPHSS